MAKVTFDGENKLILVGNGVTSINIKEDIYSEWKLWSELSDNMKFAQAISVIGGDPIGGALYLGSTFFLENNWKIKPAAWSHILTVNGNLYSRDGSNPFVQASGSFNILIVMKVSNLIDTIATGGSTGPSAEDVADAVWLKIINNKTAAEMLTKIDITSDDALSIGIANLN